jgi:hypothetical protein
MADLVADGAPVDWDDVIARADAAGRGPLRQLQVLSKVTHRVLGARATEPTKGMDRVATLLQPILWVAAVKCSLSILGYVMGRRVFAGDAIRWRCR